MIVLRFAALVSALATMVLNAHYGFTSAASLPYAVLLATLSVALDLAKCSLLLASSKALRAGAWGASALFFLMFWPCLAYMAIGKFMRYLLMTGSLIWAFPGVMGG